MLTQQRLSLDWAKKADFEDLVTLAHESLRDFEAPEVELPDQRDARIDKTLDHLPDIYAFWLEVWSWWDWQTAGYAETLSQRAWEYKAARAKRDALERVCRAFKSRYEATSRRITELQRRDEEVDMPRGRH